MMSQRKTLWRNPVKYLQLEDWWGAADDGQFKKELPYANGKIKLL